MDKYIEAIKLARSVDQLEEVAETYMHEWACMSDSDYDKIAIELTIAHERIKIINATNMN